MKRQFQHEDHNRQDRTKQADYRESFDGPVDPGGSHGSRITVADVVSGKFSAKVLQSDKERAVAFIERHLRSTTHLVSGCEYKFKMSDSDFALANNIPVQQAQPAFVTTQADATKRLQMTKNAALRAEFETIAVETSSGHSKMQLQLTSKNFLTPKSPIPWDKIYKQIRLNPIDPATQTPSQGAR